MNSDDDLDPDEVAVPDVWIKPIGELAGPTTTVGDLVAILDAVAPFADDTGHPLLECVQIDIGGGVITATATNRFVVAHARGKAAGEMEPLSVTAKRANQLASALRPFLDESMRPYLGLGEEVPVPVTLFVKDEMLLAEAGNIRATVPLTISKVAAGRECPDYATLFATPGVPTAAASLLDGPIQLPPGLLADLAKVAELDDPGTPLRFYFAAADKPVRVELSDWFLALLMPTAPRSSGVASVAEIPNVPFGLPTLPSEPTPATA